MKEKQIHLIAIGGSAMHNLALALKQNGFHVTGSDDEIVEPSLSRLKNQNLLPEKDGWFPDKIHSGLSAVILGMHARADNPELLRAQELGLKIYSYPEYLYEHARNKKRIVIGGSHGKTTITSMILHVLKKINFNFDFMVGAKLEGFDNMVRLSDDAPVMILEGDEYLSSPIDRRPKFHLYHANVALISGIAWDHINVFPTFENYVDQFRIFIKTIQPNGKLIYCINDAEVKKLADENLYPDGIPYSVPSHEIVDGVTSLITSYGKIPLRIFGTHNLMNLEGARLLCNEIGVSDEVFHKNISDFSGAAKRLEVIGDNGTTKIFKDFAHSPSKLVATIDAVRKQFPERRLISVMELHTFSSLNENFLGEYSGTMQNTDVAVVYYNHHTIEHKKLNPISEAQVRNAFGREDLSVITNSKELQQMILNLDLHNSVLLLMSSGNYDGINLEEFSQKIMNQKVRL